MSKQWKKEQFWLFCCCCCCCRCTIDSQTGAGRHRLTGSFFHCLAMSIGEPQSGRRPKSITINIKSEFLADERLLFLPIQTADNGSPHSLPTLISSPRGNCELVCHRNTNLANLNSSVLCRIFLQDSNEVQKLKT